MWGQTAIQKRLVREGLTEKMTPSPGRRVKSRIKADIWKKSAPGRRNSKFKSPAQQSLGEGAVPGALEICSVL